MSSTVRAEPETRGSQARPAIDCLLRPRSIAVVGASARENSFGARLMASLASGRYGGAVIPINPGRDFVGGRPCYPSLASLPERPDCVAFAFSDELVQGALEDAAAAGVPGAVIFGRFYDPSGARVRRLAAIARDAGMAVC